MPLLKTCQRHYQRHVGWLNKLLPDLTQLAVRLLLARLFLLSGLTKWTGFATFNTEKYDLFLYEFFCPDPVRPGALLLCDPQTLDYPADSSIVSIIEGLAVSAGVLEIVLPLLLIFGLFTRLAALGLLLMTVFIQLAVFPSWDHWWNPAAWWVASLLVLLAWGPGRLSLDRLLRLDGVPATGLRARP